MIAPNGGGCEHPPPFSLCGLGLWRVCVSTLFSTGFLNLFFFTPLSIEVQTLNKMNLKIWWKPNFLETDFEMPVKTITDAYIALEVIANLDCSVMPFFFSFF